LLQQLPRLVLGGELQQWHRCKLRANQCTRECFSRDGNGGSRGEAWGAIAYSPNSGDYGYSYGTASRTAAEQRAKRECGKADCEVAAWFSNSCGALAASDDGIWTGAQNDNERRAREIALADCIKDRGKNCEVIYSRCSR
jgi:serine/threonine-protein kinase